ncbi:MAG: phage holin family protein [Clostridia bacterium]|nr:phage holin family protein [Clostridia bacterium]MBR0407844.1 phage holin family protein [Clostridia bacterium]
MKRVTEIIAAIGGAIAGFFVGMPPIVWILVAVMSLDYLTGLLCGFMGVSPKTESGGLSSGAAFQGLMKKVLILCVVGLAALIDRAVMQGTGMEIAAVTGATCFWFVASEGLSVLENAAAMGVPIPKVLLRALEIMKRQGEEPNHKSSENP